MLGIAFGFLLERSGLGSARKLTAQFRFTDFTVLKVLFSAIVTASLGVFWLARFGVIELAAVYVPETYLLPQLAGGAVFGAGMVIAGLCPGTACVSMATGRYDGAAVLGGLLSGIAMYGGLHSLVDGFARSTARGSYTLPQLLGLSHGLVLLLLVCVALGAFRAAEWWERRTALRT
jgi:uncharacterized membrane protein YedE/YeeE